MPALFLMLTVAVAPGGTDASESSSSIAWMDDADKSMKLAEKEHRALLLYLSDDAAEYATTLTKHRKSYADPAVTAIVRDRYVAVRLTNSTLARKLLEKVGVQGADSCNAYVATGAGKLIGTITTDEASAPHPLAARLDELSQRYEADLYARYSELHFALENAESTRAELIEALRLVARYRIKNADGAVAELTRREDLDEPVREKAFHALAILSTESGVRRLLDAAVEGKSAAAARALKSCTPTGAKILMSQANLKEPERRLAAYMAATTICRIPDAKPASFWDGADTGAQRAEIERVRKLVSQAAKRSRSEAGT